MRADGGLDRRLGRIEEIVRLLDSDSIGLDEALALFEEGVGHLRGAQDILAGAELKVAELIGEKGDEVRELGPSDDAGPGAGGRGP